MKKIFKSTLWMMMFLAALSFGACDDSSSKKDSGDTTVPGEVIMTGAVAGTDSVTLTWTNPSDADFDHVELTWAAGGVQIGADDADGDLETYVISGLSSATGYDLTLTAVDASANRSGHAAVFGLFTAVTGERVYRFIYTAADLNAVHGGVEGYDGWGLDGNYIVMADIDLGVSPFNDGQGWEPIGQHGKEGTPYSGIFNGNGYAISNLTINADNESRNGSGLFGWLGDQGMILNLALVGADVNGPACSSLVFYNDGVVSGCSSNGSVSGTFYAGGLIVFNEGTVTCCHTADTVSGTNYTGGLVAVNIDTVSSCYATGDVSGTDAVGGLVGANGGTVSGCYATGAVSGTTNVGGLIGDNDGTPSNCYYDSQTTGQSDSGKGESRTTAQMKQQSTFAGWDFTGETANGTADIWSIDAAGAVNNGYPYLADNH